MTVKVTFAVWKAKPVRSPGIFGRGPAHLELTTIWYYILPYCGHFQTTPQDPPVRTVLTWCHQRLCIFGLHGAIQILYYYYYYLLLLTYLVSQLRSYVAWLTLTLKPASFTRVTRRSIIWVAISLSWWHCTRCRDVNGLADVGTWRWRWLPLGRLDSNGSDDDDINKM